MSSKATNRRFHSSTSTWNTKNRIKITTCSYKERKGYVQCSQTITTTSSSLSDSKNTNITTNTCFTMLQFSSNPPSSFHYATDTNLVFQTCSYKRNNNLTTSTNQKNLEKLYGPHTIDNLFHHYHHPSLNRTHNNNNQQQEQLPLKLKNPEFISQLKNIKYTTNIFIFFLSSDSENTIKKP